MLRTVVPAFMIAGVVSFVAFGGTSDAATPFVSETVDPAGNVGQYTSLAIDARGDPHISYYDATHDDLKYAVKLTGTWTLEVVDPTGDVGQYTSLEIDSQGHPHISYYDVANGDLKHAVKSGGIWMLEVVDATGDVGQYASLELDSQGDPHISYYDATNGDLKYAEKSGGTWLVQTVDAQGDRGKYSSLALDSQGRPNISYDGSGGSLCYAVMQAGTWSTSFVPGVGPASSIAIDAQGRPWIAYRDPRGIAACAIRGWYGGQWTTEYSYCGDQSLSLSLDRSGGAHAIGYSSVLQTLQYGSRSSGQNGTWSGENLYSPGLAQYASLDLDAHGNAGVSYYDAVNGELVYLDSAVHLLFPAGGETWPVGSLRNVRWSGIGPVNISLSADGGSSWQLLEAEATASPFELRVPLLPGRFSRLRIERAAPFSSSASDSFFTVDASIALLAFEAAPSAGGAALSWSTRPGPEDLDGYRLERFTVARGWEALAQLTRQTAYVDPSSGPGTRYRLTAVNGLGQGFLLGETGVGAAVPLAAWPTPCRAGQLRISFATAGGLGGGTGEAIVQICDVAGRVVRTVARGSYEAGYQTVGWDGRDGQGRPVASGVYFIRSSSGGRTESLKVVTTR